MSVVLVNETYHINCFILLTISSILNHNLLCLAAWWIAVACGVQVAPLVLLIYMFYADISVVYVGGVIRVVVFIFIKGFVLEYIQQTVNTV